MPRHPVRTIAALFVGLPLLLSEVSSTRVQHTPIPLLKQANTHMAEVATGYEATFYGGCADTNTTVHHASGGDPPSKTGKRAERLEAVNRWRSNAAIVVTPGKQRPCGACDLEIAKHFYKHTFRKESWS
jgi:hypothetical protein